MKKKNNLKLATFGAGCFWGVEDAFRRIPGVIDAAAGYMGGDFSDPSYKDVCNNKTGHAEVVQVKYNSLKITYYKLLESFWRMHDPTQVGRQGQDIGNQYRSVIFYHTLEQKSIFEKSKRELENSGKVKNKISTAIIPATRFWRAEEYHQRYIEKSGKVGWHT